MSWNYSGNPKSSDKDKVRFLTGDTDSTDPLLENEEIEYLLDENADPTYAASLACETIAAKFSRLCDESAGGISQSYSQKSEHYRALALILKDRYLTANAIPYAGGISESDKTTDEDNQDRVDPAFGRDLHENPGVVSDFNEKRRF